jgi:hypothetical protein
MVRHAARALPWPLLGAAALLLAMLLRAVQQWPYTVWPLQGIAVGLLAGIAAFAYDEPAAAVVDTLPRGLAWRTAARSVGIVLLLGWWLAAIAATRSGYFGHALDVALQGVAATVGVVAVTTALRRNGLASPATALASAVVSVAALVALARPLEERLPLFPYTAYGSWDSSRNLWIAVLAGATVWLVALLRR